VNNKLLYIIIFLLVIIIAGGAYFMFSGRNSATEPAGQPQAVSQSPAPLPSEAKGPSEQSSLAAFSEYLSNAKLVNVPKNQQFGPGMTLNETNVFNFAAGDQFCLSLDIIKQMPTNIYNVAVYNINSKSYSITKHVAGGPPTLQIGNNLGCEQLLVGPGKLLSAGSYEYKIYLNNILAAVLPFEVK